MINTAKREDGRIRTSTQRKLKGEIDMKQRIISLLLAAILLVGLFAGCGAGKAG